MNAQPKPNPNPPSPAAVAFPPLPTCPPGINPSLFRRLHAKKTEAARCAKRWQESTYKGRNRFCIGPRDNEAQDRGCSTDKRGIVHRYQWLDGMRSEYYSIEFWDDLARRSDHQGWYADDDGCYETLRGVVASMHTSRGVLCLPGCVSSDTGQVCLYVDDAVLTPAPAPGSASLWDGDWMQEARRDMADQADGIARVAAEHEREYRQADNLRRDAEALYEDDFSALRVEVGGVLDKIRALRAGLVGLLSRQIEAFPFPGGDAEKARRLAERLAKAFDLPSRESDLRDELAELLERREEIHAKARQMREDAAQIEKYLD